MDLKQYSIEEINNILRAFFPIVEEDVDIKIIKDGIRFVEVGGNKFVLKFYSNEINKDRITFFESLQNYTVEKLQIFPEIVKTNNHELNFSTPEGTFELSKYHKNFQFDIKKVANIDQLFYDVGQFLGLVHKTFEEYSIITGNDFDSVLHYYSGPLDHLYKLIDSYRKNNVDRSWINILEGKIRIAEDLARDVQIFNNLPKKIIHGDFYIKNLLFDDSMKIIGLIDFVQAGIYFRCYEVIRAFIQTNRSLNEVDVDPRNLNIFLKGYLENISLQKDEINKMLDLFIYIQATETDFYMLDIVCGSNNVLKEYARYRYEYLQSLYSNRQLLNRTIYEI